MPGKIKVKVLAGRNLPVMDRASDTTDAFVEIKFGGITHKTDVCRKSLNPHWSSTEWYRFEVDESELQDEPLQLRLMDHDTYSANDAIGKVVISLAPLLAREIHNTKGVGTTPGGAVLSGWIPVFDTMHGIRGELNVIVKVELFTDFNRYKTSSCGVQFFHCPSIPPGYKAIAVHGFVEELVVNDDPEYQWIDKIRTPRASNEARQVAFIKLSNQVQRLVGLKAAELGANAVVGYQQDFDLEGEAGVVARAIGTAVSIVPPPMPSQSMSIPPCTQQQLKKYLDILATDNESITDLNQYFQSHQDELTKLLNIMNPKDSALLDDAENLEDDDKCDLTRQSSIKSYTGSLSIYQDDYVSQKSMRHLSEDQTDLNKLLRRNEDSDSDSSGPLQKIKKLKTTLFTRRFGSHRSRKSEKQEDQISLKSNSSDTSRISLTELRKEFIKFKRLKKPKFTKSRKTFANKEDEGIGMASILARSVIHAHTSLACIAETQDSEHSPSSTMRRTSESEPNINVSDDDRPKSIPADTENKLKNESNVKIPEIHTSLKNIKSDESNTTTVHRKISESCPATPMTERNENLLKLPGEMGYFGSLSLSGDSSVYSNSSSEEDDESSDQKTDTEKYVETTSSVVQTVLNNTVNPAFIAQMDRKLSILEGCVPKLKESKSQSLIENCDQKQANSELSKSSPCITDQNDTDSDTLKKDIIFESASPNTDVNSPTSKSNSGHHFKFHNPFTHKKVSKSVSAPSSPIETKGFIYRSSKRIRRQLSKISNSNMIKSLSHYSLLPKKKHSAAKVTLSQPGSTSDVPSKAPSHETVLGSPFLSFADLMTLDKENSDSHKEPFHRSDELDHSKVMMYIGSEPVSRASLSGPSSPYVREESHHFDQKSLRGDRASLKSTGLLHTAMETILIDKVQSLLVPTSPEPNQSKEQQFFDNINEKLEKVEETRNIENLKNINITKSDDRPAMETALMDKFQSLLTTPDINQDTDKHFFTDTVKTNEKYSHPHENKGHSSDRERSSSQEKSDSLVQSAVKTLLIDKVQSLMPASSEPVNFSEKYLKDEETAHTKRNKHHGSFFHTAMEMETKLIDKVQSLIHHKSDGDEHKSHHISDILHLSDHTKDKKEKHESLLHTAMETILLDKAQSLIPTGSEPITCPDKPVFASKSQSTENLENVKDSHNLLHTAMETILMDKVQTLVPQPSDIAPFISDTTERINEVRKEKDGRESHVIDSTVGTNIENMTISGSNTEQKISSKEYHPFDEIDQVKDTKEDSLLHSAMETILLDSVQSLLSVANVKSDCSTSITEQSLNKEADSFERKEVLTGPTTNKEKILIRQDSLHSLPEVGNEESPIMSKDVGANLDLSPRVTHNKPVLQHFHPILSGPPLETIPSLPESSLDHAESLDVEGVERTCDCQSECQCQECDSETNSASVCDNSHAACRFDRNEREKEQCEKEKGSPRHARHESYGGREPVATSQPTQSFSLNSTSTPVGIHRRSSDSDLSVTPKGGSLNASAGNGGSGGGAILRPSMNSNNLEMLEYPFLTMTEYPPGFIVHIGGTVCARSVKLVDAGGESAARAAWWAELRTELRAHARALRCNAVIAYTESAAICEDVCVLSASGTAAVINLDCEFHMESEMSTSVPNGPKTELEPEEPELPEYCTMAHVPYSPGAGPYRVELSTCGGCKRARVPAVLLATCAKPSRMQSYARAVTVTAVAARVRRAPPASEPGARDISDQLPFLEYELHKLLLAKLRMQGANALFSLQTQIAIGERYVMALASGTAVRLAALPPPTPPRIKASETDKNALEIQRALWDSFTANKAANGYDIAGSADQIPNGALPDLETEEPAAAPALDLCVDKDACVLELDEAEDVETAKTLAMRRMHMQVFTSGMKAAPKAPPHAFAQVWRARLQVSGQSAGASTAAERHVARALDGVTYKLRRLQPCALVAPRFQLELPEDEIQLVVSGAAIPLLDPNRPEQILPEIVYPESTTPSPQPTHSNGNHSNGNHGSGNHNNGGHNHGNGTGDADDDIFTLDEEQLVKQTQPSEVGDEKAIVTTGQAPTMVSLTSLSHVSGSRTLRRICALRLLFVRETTAVRELGGLSGFLHTFTCEVLAIVRAYTAALGGNALTSFYITQLMLQDNAHKNQGQCLLSVGGDVVHITY
ncbi:uncharacterized protein LOC126380027 isoform X2 [Pectinophora gossypiella]|uniref:uncharacterized protein LOC126380027 isoform X2 n=1 Tax=Pectinophora gossypiella TaxID=13191 RepID=UPI00214E0A9D|nr:uncharacterized protein LOC126380027 isoform X2 [Pectinophora gossypiella]